MNLQLHPEKIKAKKGDSERTHASDRVWVIVIEVKRSVFALLDSRCR